MNIALHQSGRTTRKLEEALRAAYAGRTVDFLVSHPEHARILSDRLVQMCRGVGRSAFGIKISTLDDVDFDWGTMRGHRTHPNCLVLLDHSVVEERIEELQSQIADLAKEVGQLYPLTT